MFLAELEKDVTSEVKLQMRAEAEEWAQEQLRKHIEQQQVSAAATKSTITTITTTSSSSTTSSGSASASTTKVAKETVPVPAVLPSAVPIATEASVRESRDAAVPPSATTVATASEATTASNTSETTSQVTERAAVSSITKPASSEPALQEELTSGTANSNQTVNNGNRDAGSAVERQTASKVETEAEIETEASDTDAGGLSSLLASSQESLPSASSVAELPDPREDEEEREERTNFKTASERADSHKQQQQQQHSQQQQLQRRHHTGEYSGSYQAGVANLNARLSLSLSLLQTNHA